jgi:UDPglucose--hexose-1-phosphate uridylyltransferase
MRSPSSNFALEVQPIEYRRDPLTGMRCRINIRRSERVKQTAEHSSRTPRVIEESKKGCMFCPENLESMTPRFPDQLIGVKRLKVGSAVLFPNLYPFAEHHAIAVFSEQHDIALDEFSPEIIGDCIRVCVKYLNHIRSRNRDVRYGSVNWNYMPPAGGSVIHPHLQVLADRSPTYLQERLIQSSEAYFRKYESNYWHDLVETERKLEQRLIHVGDSLAWLAAYAPQGNNEVLAVFHKFCSIAEMDERSLAELSAGISEVLKGYSDLGVESLNMSLLSGPLDSTLDYYALNLRMNSRPGLKEYYTSDCGFMEKIQLESVIESRPEEVAKILGSYFMTTE